MGVMILHSWGKGKRRGEGSHSHAGVVTTADRGLIGQVQWRALEFGSIPPT